MLNSEIKIRCTHSFVSSSIMQPREHIVITVAPFPPHLLGDDATPGLRENSAGPSSSAVQQVRDSISDGAEPMQVDPPAQESSSSTSSTNRFTVVTGGHFLSASLVVHSLCTVLHMTLLNNVVTNVEHEGMWRVFGRVAVFWMDVTMSEL